MFYLNKFYMSFFFIILSFLILALALAPTLFNNPVRSVLAFILVFLLIACILLYIDIEFLAFVYAIVYIGAVAVLFLFVVMLLKVSSKYYSAVNIYYIFLLVSLILVLTWQTLIVLLKKLSILSDSNNTNFLSHKNITESAVNFSETSTLFIQNELYVIASKFYTLFSMLFIETAFILVIALIGIIVLVTQQENFIAIKLK